MSFLNIRGEKIYCEKCGECITIEYEGGPQMTQIGDMEVYEQMEVSKELLPDYDAEKYGYYFIRVAVCSKCKSKRKKVFDDDYILFRYMDKYNELEEFKENMLEEMVKYIRKNLSEDMLREIDADAYEELKQKKHFGIKKEKVRIAEEYVRRAKRNIYPYMQKQFNKDERLIRLADELRQLEPEAEAEVIKYWRSGLKGYCKISITQPRNLNPYICYDATIRTPKEKTGNVDMYDDVELDLSRIRKTIRNKNKFSYNRGLEKDEISNFYKRLPNYIAKLNF
ncbi:MAG: hypothetical protein K5664_04770 [Firmicutes bacterium]|nr:hypothetical protein [Bacillota bacterium]